MLGLGISVWCVDRRDQHHLDRVGIKVDGAVHGVALQAVENNVCYGVSPPLDLTMPSGGWVVIQSCDNIGPSVDVNYGVAMEADATESSTSEPQSEPTFEPGSA